MTDSINSDVIMMDDIVSDETEIIPIILPGDDPKLKEADIPEEMAVMPLRNAVLFPGTLIPITVGRDKSIRLVKDAYKQHKAVGVISQRDHRKLGKELELFMFTDMVGKGLPMWLPKGTALRLRLQEFLTRIQKHYGYEQVMTPHIGNKQLYVTSGHWDHYGHDSFQPITTPEEGEMYLLKPMNCPHHCMIYKYMPRSYKDLPLRLTSIERISPPTEVHARPTATPGVEWFTSSSS